MEMIQSDQAKRLPPKQWTKEWVEKEVLPHIPLTMFNAISGSIGGVTFVTSSDGKISVRDRPGKRKGKPNRRQKAQQTRFKRAAAYAKKVLADPDTRAIYDAGVGRRDLSPFNLAMSQHQTNQPAILNHQRFVGDRGQPRGSTELCAGKSCGYCGWSWAAGKDGQLLCLNPGSPYAYDIVPVDLACPEQDPNPD
jgi:hypothetical protein